MAKTRVCDLAKEFGMTSKELLGYLKDMKILATSPSSALEDAFVGMVRKKLAPVLEAKKADLEAAKQAEQEAKDAEEKAAREAAERERLAAEERRKKERAAEEAAREAAERAQAEEEKRRIAEEELLRSKEEKLKEEEERQHAAPPPPPPPPPPQDTAPKQARPFNALLDQIMKQEKVLAEKKAPLPEPEKARTRKKGVAAAKDTAQKNTPLMLSDAPTADKPQSKRRRGRRKSEHTEEDRYTRMAREAEEYNRQRILRSVRADIEEASRESLGRRKKRKERRQMQAEAAAEKQAIDEALANDQDISKIGVKKVPTGSTVAELAELLDVPANDIVKRLFLLGNPLTMTQSMSDDLIELIADDFGREIKIMTKEEENSFTFYDDPKDLRPRPPVVTVMGHVDHGKTSLLDAIRHTGVAEGEAGGITQHIGASQIHINNRTITFVDTPGHEAFTAMRARGAKVTDIAILVVAADDGVMPQTIESISHTKIAEVPIVVAINKCDKPGANPDRVRQELTEYDVIPEEWGGQTMFVNISAKNKEGIEDLLETVLLQADVLELQANPNTFASGYVLEAKLDRGRGPVATVLVNRGTLHPGDAIVAGTTYGRVRAMIGQNDKALEFAGPSDPVEILGLQSVPAAGDEFRVFTDERDARDLAEQRALKARIEEQSKVRRVTLETFFESVADAELSVLNLVVKADVQGSIEALSDALSKMDQSEVRTKIIHSAVGTISETDVILAAASNAIIIGFGVRPDAKARAAAEHNSVQIKCYSVIYKAIEDINAARIGMLKPTEEEHQKGVAEVRDTFKVPKVGLAAGCMVTEGEISRDDRVRLVRDGIVVYDGKLASVRRFKEDVKTVRSGYECGLGFVDFQDIHVGDTVEAYTIVEVVRTE